MIYDMNSPEHVYMYRTWEMSGSESPFNITTIYHNSLSLSFGDPVAGSRVAVSSLTYKTDHICVCVCVCLCVRVCVCVSAQSAWRLSLYLAKSRTGSSEVGLGLCCSLFLSSASFTRSVFRLAFDSWREGHPGFEEAGIALGVAWLVRLSVAGCLSVCVCVRVCMWQGTEDRG